MWINHILIGLSGLIFGAAVSGGAFALFMVMGIIPRILWKWKLKEHILLAEQVLMLGLLCGAIFSIRMWSSDFGLLGRVLISLFGLGAGVYVGCLAASLAEILHVFPILFRRLHMKRGIEWAMLAMAIGKLIGAVWYFLFGYGVL